MGHEKETRVCTRFINKSMYKIYKHYEALTMSSASLLCPLKNLPVSSWWEPWQAPEGWWEQEQEQEWLFSSLYLSPSPSQRGLLFSFLLRQL